MDPNACLAEWALAMASNDRTEANERYFALRAWLERGGFEPEWSLDTRREFFSYNPRTGTLKAHGATLTPVHGNRP